MKKETQKRSNKRTVIIATGGTGGHIFPARAFAQTLINNNYNVVIIADEKYLNFINEKDKIESKIIGSGRNLKKISDIYGITKGIFQAYFFIKAKNPDVIVGFGGYASLPTLLASKFLKKKIILQEENAYIGKINKFFVKYADIIATSYREFYGIKYDYMKKIRFVGVPIRDKIKELAKIKYRTPNFSKHEKLNVLILGGSGGAKFFGTVLADTIAKIEGEYSDKLNIIHQCRKENIEEVKKVYSNSKIKHEVKSFFTDIDKKIGAAHLVIARAGASSIAEFTATGKPMILIPFPSSANGHQLKNALSLVSKNAAILIEQKKFKEQEFLKLLEDFIANPEKLEELAKKSKEQGILDADIKLLHILEGVINE